MTAAADFLFELGTEELPPRALSRLSQALLDGVRNALDQAALSYSEIKAYATPRRLAVLVSALQTEQAETIVERRGPAVTAAFDGDGNPTPAAVGFARSAGVDVNDLETLETDKGAWLVHRFRQPGQQTSTLLADIMQQALDRLPIPKRMRWGNLDVEFVRPVHWLVMLFDDHVIDAHLYGVRAGRETYGHRFHSPGALYLPEPVAYAPLLESEGRVMVDFAERREAIRAQVMKEAVSTDGAAVIDEELLDEVTGMVEWPVAVLGKFDAKFLDVPPEVLVSAMKTHQKYFHIVDDHSRLLPYFVTVSNIDSRDMAIVRAGNERVIRPRLADAAFFWVQDRKTRLESHFPAQRDVVFQKKLGSLHDKTQRVRHLAGHIADELGADRLQAERAATLSKCDLMTAMVGEFPELQGIMGCYYARHDGEKEAVAIALDEQYRPRHAGDDVAENVIGQALAIADKLDTLAGLFSIGEIPSGTRDPFALRRAGLGVLRTIIERDLSVLDLRTLIDRALAGYQQAAADAGQVAGTLFDFMMERLRHYYLEQEISHDVFAAVLALQPTRPTDFAARLHAVTRFRELPEADSLAAANKRIGNILRKAEDPLAENFAADKLVEPAEQALAQRLAEVLEQVTPGLESGDYTEALTGMAALRETVDTFFDHVMVMTDDQSLRRNRLALLNVLHKLFLRVADISCLQPVNDN